MQRARLERIAVGKRKTAIARAIACPGKGIVRINSKLLSTLQPYARAIIEEPLLLIGDDAKKFDVDINVKGGGVFSQAEAARTALCKAISELDKSLAKKFLAYDRFLLVSDVRQKEQHKEGRHGKARAKRQKSYR